MKLNFFIIAFLSLNILIAQNTTKLQVTESESFTDDTSVNEAILAIHTTKSGKTGLIRANNNFLLDIFDNQLNKISSKKTEKTKKETFNGYVSFENEIKFISVYSPNKRERIVYCNTFDIENNTFSKKELFRADVEKGGGLFSGRNKRGTNVAISPNGTFIAIATDNIKKNLNSYKVHVFDTQTLTLVFEKSYQEDIDNYFEPNDLFIDENATVYTLGKLFIAGKSQKKEGKANYDFVLNDISKENFKSLKISLENDLHISSLSINYHENKLSLIGFYSNERAGNIKGGCNFEINTANLSVKSIKNSILPKDVYEDLYGNIKGEENDKKKRELNSFYVDYTLRDSNGNTFLLAEEFYITTNYISTGYGGFVTYTYHYDDILILKFDKTGELNWGRSIFKRSNSPSYNAFLKNDELHVLLNSGKNLTEKTDGRTKVSKGWFESTALYDFTYSINGNVEYNKIQDNKGKNFYMPYYGIFYNDKFIMSSDGDLKKQFMILK